MAHSIFDRITDWLASEAQAGRWFSVYHEQWEADLCGRCGTRDPADARTPVGFDPDTVVADILAYHERAERVSPAWHTFTYWVRASDGAWHHSVTQLYAMLEGEPYLTPEAWLTQASAA